MGEPKLVYKNIEYGVGELFIWGNAPLRISGFMVTVNGVQIFGTKYINGEAIHITIPEDKIAKLIKVKEE